MYKERATSHRWAAGDLVLAVIAGVLALVLIAAISLIGILRWRDAQAEQERSDQQTPVELSDMVPGDCVAEFPFLLANRSSYVLVDCAGDHAAELVYRDTIDESPEGELSVGATQDLARSICDTTNRYHLHLDADVQAEYPNAMLYGLYEGPVAYAQGANRFNCFLINSDGSALQGQYFLDEDLG